MDAARIPSQMLAEIQDAQGKPIAGFSLDACDPIYGDHIGRVVTWKKESDVGRLKGTAIKLRFVMSDADLFALKFQDTPG